MNPIEWLLFASMLEEMIMDFAKKRVSMTPEEMQAAITEGKKKKQEFLDWMASVEQK